MPGRQARVMTNPVTRRALLAVRGRPDALRDCVMVLLSLRAGLRACEIAGLDWTMVLDPAGRVAHALAVPDRIAKRGGGRRVPLHPELRRALIDLWRESERAGPVIPSRRGGHMRPNSAVNWFIALFAEIGAEGAPATPGGGRSSPTPPATPTAPGPACATCSSWPATAASP